MTDQEKKLQGAVYSSALAAAQAGPKPTYAGTFEGQLNDIFDKIQNREKFSYNVNEDPLYQSYKDQYIQGGKLAMKDTMGQAAALTGGYGSTYGQQVGQQAYNAYLQNLSAVIPELYDRAYGVYRDEGDDLKDQFALAGAMRDEEYGRYRDDMGDWDRDRAIAIDREQEDYNRRQTEAAIARQLEEQDYNRRQAEAAIARQQEEQSYNRRQAEAAIARQLEEQNYNRRQAEAAIARQQEEQNYNRRQAEAANADKRQQQAYSNLIAMIKSSGYVPSAAELAAAGMSAGQAGAMRNEYNRQVAAEQAAAAMAARELEAKIAGGYWDKYGTGALGVSGGGSGGGSGGSGGSGGGRSGGGGGGYSGGDDGWYDYGGSGDYWESDSGDSDHYTEMYNLAQQAVSEGEKMGDVYEVLKSDPNLTVKESAKIAVNVSPALSGSTGNANVNRSALGSPTAFYTPGVNMGGTGADRNGNVVSSNPISAAILSAASKASSKVKDLFR